MKEKFEIIAKPEDMCFEAMADGKVIGEIDFHYSGDSKVLAVTHTGVRKEYEGQGIAGALNKALLEYVRENHLRVIPECPYTKTYIERHPEYQDLLANA